MVRVLDFESMVPGSNPTLSTSWICFTAVPRILKDYGRDLILRCNIKPSDISYDHLPRLYCDCLTAWSTINNKRISSTYQVFDEILWNNQFLRIGNKPLFNKKLFAKGIVHASDILSEDGKLLSWDHFRGKGLNFNDYLLIFGLSKALPGSWRNLLHTDNNDKTHQNERNSDLSLQLNDEAVSLSALTSKKLYWLLVAQKRVSPTASQKYETLFPNHKINWDLIHSIPFKVTVDVKTRCFQFNLLHRIIYTNKLLCKMNLVDSGLCTFCEEEIESLEHLFFHCKISQDFWNSVFLWLNELHFGIDALNEIDIMLSYTSKSHFWTLLNHIIITGKQIIYHNRQRKTTPLLCHLTARTH